jgi:hypothetical protein
MTAAYGKGGTFLHASMIRAIGFLHPALNGTRHLQPLANEQAVEADAVA